MRFEARYYTEYKLKNCDRIMDILMSLDDDGTVRYRVKVPIDDLTVNDELAAIYLDVVEKFPDFKVKIEPIPEDLFEWYRKMLWGGER